MYVGRYVCIYVGRYVCTVHKHIYIYITLCVRAHIMLRITNEKSS